MLKIEREVLEKSTKEKVDILKAWMKEKEKRLKLIDPTINLYTEEDYDDFNFLLKDMVGYEKDILNSAANECFLAINKSKDLTHTDDRDTCPHCWFYNCNVCPYGERHGVCVESKSNYQEIIKKLNKKGFESICMAIIFKKPMAIYPE